MQIYAQNTMENNYLYRVCDDTHENCGYINSNGDTIIGIGKYPICYTDTLKTFAIVLKEGFGFIGIDKSDEFLFQIYTIDNGPDTLSEGLFRILSSNNKIGYADACGNIIIKPQFDCAFPFSGSKAKVSFKCKVRKENNKRSWISNKWLFIDKKGNVLNL